MLSYLNPFNSDYVERLYAQYQTDPEGLDPSWRYFFDGLSLNAGATAAPEQKLDNLEFEIKVLELIQAYREMGFLIADVNPLQRGIQSHPLLTLENYGLKEADLERVCQIGRVLGFGAVPLKQILHGLTAAYCSPVGVDFDHIEDPKSRQWIQTQVESSYLNKGLAAPEQKRLIQKLCEAQMLEEFLHKRFVGAKRFSVEGAEAVIPMLDFLIDEATRRGADEILLGMAHRGRLNVLANIFKKDLKIMLAEFSGHLEAQAGDGDVKYHMGFSQNTESFGGKPVHLSLMPNPSHLEAVNAVLMGVARAKQKIKKDFDQSRTLAVLIHGDASFSGQGVIYETLNMSELPGYNIGGTIHIIINNQIGYTTTPRESRSTPQATDIAKMLEIPIFRVNADEVEACIRTMTLAVNYRYEFKRDVVIDLVGYRRYGHNEGDEPSYTQPQMYAKVANHSRVLDIYRNQLKIRNSIITDAEINGMLDGFKATLEAALEEAKKGAVSPAMSSFGDRWGTLQKASEKTIFQKANTAVSWNLLEKLGRQLIQFPKDFNLHPKLKRTFEDKIEMLEGKKPLDWALAEALGFASLMVDGYRVRLAGQDAERGTFAHRHSVLHDYQNGKKYTPLNDLQGIGELFEVVNSPLSEYAALGFEFGQSLANPNKLTIWEAQFGDFCNGAQIIIDQFLTCSAFKWRRHSGLVMLLPHGYEGQGPEHSSARLERFLQLCGQNNIQVCNLTKPAQLFHAFRRQMVRDFRMPLIIMSPKSLFRHPLVVSPISEFENGGFEEVLDDSDPSLKEKAKRVVLCSGKIYYELLEARTKLGSLVPLIRIEQFYPFPREALQKVLDSYINAKEIVWCQEGPQNAEGYSFMLQQLMPMLKGRELKYAGRPAQASPADGYLSVHQEGQKKIVMTALGEI